MPKFGVRKRKQFLKLLEDGSRRMAAAQMVGISYMTVYRQLKSDQEFAEAVDEAEMNVDEQVVDALFDAAVSGNVTACQVWLYNRRPEQWSDRRNQRIEHSGPDGGPIPVESQVDISKVLADPVARKALETLGIVLEGEGEGNG